MADTKHRVTTGSQPYSDGSGFRYDIDVQMGRDGLPFLWLGRDKALHVDLHEWDQLKSDVDKAIAAFRTLGAEND